MLPSVQWTGQFLSSPGNGEIGFSEACYSLKNINQMIPSSYCCCSPTVFGSDLAKMESFNWNGIFLVDRLVSLSAAGHKDVIPIGTSRMCLLWVPEGRNGAVLAINISLKWAWKLQQFAEM